MMANEFKYDNIEKYKYRLTADYKFEPPGRRPRVRNGLLCPHKWLTMSLSDRELLFQEGYCWDGSSGPTIDSKKCQLAGLIHDGAYQLLRNGVYGAGEDKEKAREYFDNLYYEMCVADGMGTYRAWVRWKGLRLFGRRAANAHE
jgi:hypothetical protein